MSPSGMSDEQLTALYEAMKAPGGMERLRRAFDELAPWFEGFLEGLRVAAGEVARVKQGGLDQDQEERIAKIGNWMHLRDLIVELASAQDGATARALIDAVPAPPP